MKDHFHRESEGVYKFGQRRVHIKVERGKEARARNGEGFITMQKFVDQYMKGENDRVDRS